MEVVARKSESTSHAEIKYCIFRNFNQLPWVRGVIPEYKIGRIIPDLYVVMEDKQTFAIEVQVSKVKRSKVLEKCNLYYLMGVPVMWIGYDDYALPISYEVHRFSGKCIVTFSKTRVVANLYRKPKFEKYERDGKCLYLVKFEEVIL